nr:MAG TPA: hypothetical protein [Caudoviricetes sp.]
MLGKSINSSFGYMWLRLWFGSNERSCPKEIGKM